MKVRPSSICVSQSWSTPSHTSTAFGLIALFASLQSPLLVTLPAIAEHELTAVADDEPKPSLSVST